MRLSSLAAARPAYYDRNATSSYQIYGSSLTPHAATTRFTVTVASGKKQLIEAAFVNFTREIAATIVGLNYAQVTVNGVTISQTQMTNNTVGAGNTYITTGGITAYPADVIVGTTADQSTGGQIYFNVQYRATQYDA